VTAKETLELANEKVPNMLGKKAKRKARDAAESSFAYNPSEKIAFSKMIKILFITFDT